MPSADRTDYLLESFDYDEVLQAAFGPVLIRPVDFDWGYLFYG